MFIADFFSWWYGAGWKHTAQHSQRSLERTLAAFSVPTLLRTLFAPWKRIVTAPGAGISEHMRAALDNAISRLVGFSVRLIALIAATVAMTGLAIVGLFRVIAWPLLPPIAVICLIAGFVL